MKFLIVAGPPASGKTSVLLRVMDSLATSGMSLEVAKFDCLHSDDSGVYQRAGFPSRLHLSRSTCPDHFTLVELGEIYLDARARQVDLLVLETAGLCDRCSPFLRRVPSLCLLGLTSNLRAPAKMLPMIQGADCVVLTKGELVSQAEREVFRQTVRQLNPQAKILEIDGLTGEGSRQLCGWVDRLPHVHLLQLEDLRYPLPRGQCSYCTGGVE